MATQHGRKTFPNLTPQVPILQSAKEFWLSIHHLLKIRRMKRKILLIAMMYSCYYSIRAKTLMRKCSLGIYFFFVNHFWVFLSFFFFLVRYINITKYTVNKLYNMVVYSILLSEVFLWYMLRPLTCNPQKRKEKNLGWIYFIMRLGQ